MNAARIIEHLDSAGVPVIITTYPGYVLKQDATAVDGVPLEDNANYLTFMHAHVCQDLINGLGNPETIVHTQEDVIIYYLWKIE